MELSVPAKGTNGGIGSPSGQLRSEELEKGEEARVGPSIGEKSVLE